MSKKTLNLRSVQIHGQNPVGTGGGEHIGNQLRGDGIPGLGFPILTGIPKVGITAVIRPAEARRQASIITSSSIRWSLTGLQVD